VLAKISMEKQKVINFKSVLCNIPMHEEFTRLASRDNRFRDPGISATYPKNLKERERERKKDSINATARQNVIVTKLRTDFWRLAFCKLFKKSRVTLFDIMCPLGIGCEQTGEGGMLVRHDRTREERSCVH
jgi:hypothetical protein